MKKIAILLIVAVCLAACGSSDQKIKGHNNMAHPGDTTSIQWLDSTVLDLGYVKEGQIVEVNYHFKNSGDKNLVIENVSASCGCTVPEKPEEPIAPGAEDVIKAKFDSRGKPGEQHKRITVIANTPERTHYLEFKVQVNP